MTHARVRLAAFERRSVAPNLPPPPHPPFPVPADGTVPFLSGERIAFSYLTSQKFTGDVATLGVLRAGEPHTLHISVRRGGGFRHRGRGGAPPARLPHTPHAP